MTIKLWRTIYKGSFLIIIFLKRSTPVHNKDTENSRHKLQGKEEKKSLIVTDKFRTMEGIITSDNLPDFSRKGKSKGAPLQNAKCDLINKELLFS